MSVGLRYTSRIPEEVAKRTNFSSSCVRLKLNDTSSKAGEKKVKVEEGLMSLSSSDFRKKMGVGIEDG